MYIAGIDIGGTNLKFGVFDDGLELVYSRVIRSVRADTLASARQIKNLIAQSPFAPSVIGAGVPGAVFRPSGRVNSGNLRWAGVSFGETLEKETGLKVWLDNDAQAALAAETLPGGSCHGLETAVYLTLGTGVGGALLIGGKPWRGHDNAGAELGHFITHAGGMRCGCGQKGCFEMYASAGALSRCAGGVRARVALDRAREGDEAMKKALDRYARELAVGLCSLYMVFRPQAIVLGGGVSAGGDMLLESVLSHVPSAYNYDAGIMRGVLRIASRQNEAGMLGAAVLAKMHLSAPET
ncbi:MAG: ROK family protein [Clostridia bacterium]|nr:ROK family protein [Clostridia bacterium]